MIKAAANVNGQILLVLALSRDDTTKLHKGGVYTIDIMTPEGKAGALLLTCAETNADAERMVRQQLADGSKLIGVQIEIVP